MNFIESTCTLVICGSISLFLLMWTLAHIQEYRTQKKNQDTKTAHKKKGRSKPNTVSRQRNSATQSSTESRDEHGYTDTDYYMMLDMLDDDK